MNLELTSLKKAVNALERSLSAVENSPGLEKMHDEAMRETLKAGVIQHFEVAYEQSWKYMQRWLRENAAPEDAAHPRTRRDLFRMAARHGLISDPEPWFEFGEARNISTQTYDESRAQEVYEYARKFPPHARELLERLESAGDRS